MTTAATTSRGLGLLRVLAILAAVTPIFLTQDPRSAVPEEVRVLSALLWMLCWLPALVYLYRPVDRRPPIPFLPIIGIAHATYYALQLTVGVDNVNQVQRILVSPLDPLRDYSTPVRLALWSWVALLVGYAVTKQVVPPRPLRLERAIPPLLLRAWAIRLLVGGILFDFLRQAVPVPLVLRGALNFAAMLAQFGMAILIVLNVRGHLQRSHQAVMYAGIAAILLLAVGTGSIAAAAFASLSALIALWIGAQRVRPLWIVTALAAGAIFVALRGVAMDYRQVAWFTNERLPVAQRSQVILAMLHERVQRDGVGGAVAHGWEVVSTRSANMDLFADVVRRTPRDVPYWAGETYLSLVGMAVPRVLWPGKPVKQLGQAFGHRYSYLGDWDSYTSVNLPYFVEFYCNFGSLGVIVGMLIVGVIYAGLEQRLNTPRQGSLVSICALVLLIPLVNIESDFSLIFGGLLLNGVALWMVLKFIGRAAAGGRAPAARAFATAGSGAS